jgi:hypothetical protein
MSDKTCACPSTSARRCYEIRYPPPLGDFERSRWFEDQDIHGSEECECSCHEPAEYPADLEGPNGECPICGGIECKPGCRDGSEVL